MLAESPESGDCAKRGLIFSEYPPGADLVSRYSSSPVFSLDVRAGGVSRNSSGPRFSLDSRANGGERLCGQ